MKIIGITGGVGSGKSSVLELINNRVNAYILRADELAKTLEKKGEVCYEPLLELLGETILDEDGEINPKKMAATIFKKDSNDTLKRVNEIIHPKVKERIIELIKECQESNKFEYFFLEAALLIEEHYELICDELWYIYADEKVRTQRLKETRGYSDEKIKGIISSQLGDETFRKFCKIVIDNSGNISDTEKQLDKILG